MKATFTLWGDENVQILPFGGLREVFQFQWAVYLNLKGRTTRSTNRNKPILFPGNQKLKLKVAAFSRHSRQFSLRGLIGLTAAFVMIGQMWIVRFWFRDSHSKKILWLDLNLYFFGVNKNRYIRATGHLIYGHSGKLSVRTLSPFLSASKWYLFIPYLFWL